MDKIQILRKISQVFFFIRFVFISSLCLCFYGVLEQIFISGSTALIQKIIIIAIITLIFGRLFCGFACPFGFLQELAYKIKKRKKLPKINREIHNKLIYLKYFVMVGFLLLAYYLSTYAFCNICPIGFVSRLSGTLLALFLAILFIVISYFIPRFFCKYICPLGAFLSIFSIYPIFQLKLNNNCVKCRLCEFKCPMQIEITKNITQRECIRCFECMSACRKGGLSFKPFFFRR